MSSATFALVNLGCRVNRVESDLIARSLEDAGLALVPQTQADVIIVNTCAVTGEAEAKTRKALRRAARMPQAPLVIATGCVASLFADDLRALAPNIVVVPDKASVASYALAEVGGSRPGASPAHRTTPTPTGRTRPGIKVQDGCDLRCSYCIVWKARGASRSMPVDQVVDAVESAISDNAREIVLTGINLGRYDDGGKRLPDLLETLLERTDAGRLRLSSIEPQDVDDRLISLMASSDGRIAPYLHMCLQSGSDTVLRRMGRVYTSDEFAERVEAAYAAIPHLAIETDLIVGFPGETDEDFREMIAFLREARYDAAYTFIYSPHSGTPAAEMDGQVPDDVKHKRLHELMAVQNEISLEINERLKGETVEVLVEGPSKGDEGVWTGRTRTDKIVLWRHGAERVGDLAHVTITQPQTWVLKGELIGEGQSV